MFSEQLRFPAQPRFATARRAVLVFLTLPVAAAFLLLIGFTSRGTTQLALLIPGLIALPVYSLIPSMAAARCPCHSPPKTQNRSGAGLIMFVVMFISMALSGLAAWSWADGWFLWFVVGEAAVAALIYAALRRSLEICAGLRWSDAELLWVSCGNEGFVNKSNTRPLEAARVGLAARWLRSGTDDQAPAAFNR